MYVSTDWADIAYHYLLDNKGYVYEARNPRAFPSAVFGYVIVISLYVNVASRRCRSLVDITAFLLIQQTPHYEH